MVLDDTLYAIRHQMCFIQNRALEFYLWEFFKSLVYDRNPIDSPEILKNGIIVACDEIRNTSEIFECFRQPLKRRCGICIVVEGNHFQQLSKF